MNKKMFRTETVRNVVPYIDIHTLNINEIRFHVTSWYIECPRHAEHLIGKT